LGGSSCRNARACGRIRPVDLCYDRLHNPQGGNRRASNRCSRECCCGHRSRREARQELLEPRHRPRPRSGKRLRIRRSVKGVTKRQAEAELRRLIGEIEQGTYIEPTKLTLGEYLQRWLKDSAEPRLAPSTVANYLSMIERHIIPALGHVPLSALQPLHLQEFYLDRLARGRVRGGGGVSRRTVVLIHTVLHAALKQAVKWQLLSRNPADAVDVPRPQRSKVRTLNDEELARFLEAVSGHRDEHLIRMALVHGSEAGGNFSHSNGKTWTWTLRR